MFSNNMQVVHMFKIAINDNKSHQSKRNISSLYLERKRKRGREREREEKREREKKIITIMFQILGNSVRMIFLASK